MGITSPEGYDPLASMSVMEQLRTASNTAPAASKLPMIGSLPVVQQFQVLGVLTIAFLALAVFMLFLDNRTTSQQSLQASAATEMQMLSQRLARGSALAAQGQAAAFAAVRDSRERFKADLDALLAGGAFKGATLDPTQDPAAIETLNAIKARWERVDAAAKRLTDNEKSLTSLANGLAAINQGNNGLLELAQQASQQIAQGGGTVREVDYANQLAVLSQRIAKNANTLASADEIDPEVAFLLGKDDATFRDVLNGLRKGSDALRLALRGVRRCTGHARRARQAVRRLRIGRRRDPVEHGEPGRREAGGAQHQQRVRAAARGRDQTCGAIRKRRQVARVGARACHRVRAARARRLALIAKVFLADARLRAQDSEHENKRNQEAILRLLNEMGDLADGDLTVRAQVTEDITGAIADSMNYTIDELRTLVAGVHNAADPGDEDDARRSRSRPPRRGRRAPVEGDRGDDGAGAAGVAIDLRGVAQRRRQSARVAQRSLAAADKGGARGAELDLGHERHPRADPGDVEADQAPGRIVAGDRRDRGADLGHHRADERARAERRHPGRVGRRSGARLLGGCRRSAAPRRTLGRSDQADRRDREDHSGGHAGRGGGHGEVDAGRGRRREALRRGGPGADRRSSACRASSPS